MKKILLMATLAAAAGQGAQAQSFHVCNDNGTVLEIPVKENKEITFNASQRLIKFLCNGNTMHSLATERIDSIAMLKPLTGTSLGYTADIDITDTAVTEFDEVVETLITDETIDESGDFIENFSPEKRVTITFSESGVKYTPSIVDGVTFTVKNGTNLTVNSTTGKVQYIVKGTCSNGSIKIYSTKKFQMMLGGLTLTNPQGPAINIQTGKTIYMTLGAGTENTLCDGATYAAPAVSGGVEEDQKGTLFSEGQMIFNGSGTLNVTSLGGHAICSDDYIRVRSGKINILGAAKDGFHTNDQFRVGRMAAYSPVINVTATGDGIDCGKGTVTIEAGKMVLNTGGEGIKASYDEGTDATIIPDIVIKGGYIDITTTGAKSSGIKATGNYTQTGGIVRGNVSGNGSKIVNTDGGFTFQGGRLAGISSGTVHAADTTSAGGIKCEGDIRISDGTIALKCTGEGAKAVNGDSDVTVDGGHITLLSVAGNSTDGADEKKSRALTCLNLTQNGGTLLMKAYDKAVSASSLTITDGIMHAVSTNDTRAINTDAVQTGGWLLTIGEE